MSDTHLSGQPLKKAGRAVAEQGVVLLEGPDGIAISLTPEAAQDTGESLIAAAEAARRQPNEPPS